ncbi:ribonucleoside-diphosphate reductase large subunit [Tanacetum coccineum]
MWGVTPSDLWDWSALRAMISKNGVRNSLLVAPMPTASTSQILGNNECFEPYTSNIYSRRVLSGEFVVVNKHLLHDLTEMGLWTPTLKNQIIYEDGSVQKIAEIPEDLKAIYKTVWEIKQRTLVDMAVDRGCYIDQSQSLNIHMDQPNFGKLTSLHFHTWSKGLKTGMYYLRSRAAADAIKFTVDTSILKVASVNSTKNVNVASTNEVNVVGRKASIELPDDSNMPDLEDIVYSDDDEDVSAEAHMNNLDAFMLVSPILTTRVHKDHPVEQINRDLNSAPQTRRMIKNLEEHGLFSLVQQ